MIRVIYRWEVRPKDFEDFRRVWTTITNRVHESVPGALGSFMLRSSDSDSEVLTVAKWESMESWKKFWGRKIRKRCKKCGSWESVFLWKPTTRLTTTRTNQRSEKITVSEKPLRTCQFYSCVFSRTEETIEPMSKPRMA